MKVTSLNNKSIKEVNYMKDIKRKKKKGFTLIELIVVIAIIGILAAIAVPKLSGFTTSSKKQADYATAATIGHAAQAYVVDHPTATTIALSDLTGTSGLLPATTAANAQSSNTAWVITLSGAGGDVTVKDSASTPTTFYPKP